MSIERVFQTIPLALLLQALGSSQAVNQINNLISERLALWHFPYTYLIAPSAGEVTLFDAINKRKIVSFPSLDKIFNYLFQDLRIQDARILIKKGVYETEELSFNSTNIVIEGEGMGNTIIRLKYPRPNNNVLFYSGTNIVIRNLTLDWNAQNKTLWPNIGTEVRVIRPYTGSYHIIENVELLNGPYSVMQVVDVSNLIIRGMRTSGGIGTPQIGANGTRCINHIITDCIFEEGFAWTSGISRNVIFMNNIVGSKGMFINPTSSNSAQDGIQDCIIAFNHILGGIGLVGRQGINAIAFKRLLLIGNVINGGISIREPNSNNANITDILIAMNILKGGGSGDGININFASKLKIIANIIKNFGTAINEVAGDSNYCLLNDVADNTNKITLTALTSKKLNNIGDDI